MKLPKSKVCLMIPYPKKVLMKNQGVQNSLNHDVSPLGSPGRAQTPQALRHTLTSISEVANETSGRIGILSKTNGMRMTNKKFYTETLPTSSSNRRKFELQQSVPLEKEVKRTAQRGKIRVMTKVHIRDVPLRLKEKGNRGRVTVEKVIKLKRVNREWNISQRLKKLFKLGECADELEDTTKDTVEVSRRSVSVKKKKLKRKKLFRIKKRKQSVAKASLIKPFLMRKTASQSFINRVQKIISPQTSSKPLHPTLKPKSRKSSSTSICKKLNHSQKKIPQPPLKLLKCISKSQSTNKSITPCPVEDKAKLPCVGSPVPDDSHSTKIENQGVKPSASFVKSAFKQFAPAKRVLYLKTRKPTIHLTISNSFNTSS